MSDILYVCNELLLGQMLPTEKKKKKRKRPQVNAARVTAERSERSIQ